MVIGDEIVRLAPVLKFDSRLHHSKVISNVKTARRLDATQDSRLLHASDDQIGKDERNDGGIELRGYPQKQQGKQQKHSIALKLIKYARN